VSTSRSRGVSTRCEQNAREVPPFVAVLTRRKRCAVLVRGGASPAETTARTFTRSGPVHADTPLRRRRLGGSSARAVPARGRTKVKAGKVRHLSLQHEERSSSRSVPVHRRIAEVGRTPSGSEKRATCNGRVESLVAIPERVNGSLTIGGRSGAQAQEPIGGKRGADPRSSAILIT